MGTRKWSANGLRTSSPPLSPGKDLPPIVNTPAAHTLNVVPTQVVVPTQSIEASPPASPRWDDVWQSSSNEPSSNSWVAGPSRNHSDATNVVMPAAHQLYSKPHFAGGIRMPAPTS